MRILMGVLAISLVALLTTTTAAVAGSGWTAADRIGTARGRGTVSVAEHAGHLYVLTVAPPWKGCRSWLYTDRSGEWHREIVPAGCAGGEIAVDAQGNVHIVFLRMLPGDCAGWCPKGLFYATNKSGTWRTERVLLGYAQPPSIAIGPDGQPVVAYHGAGRMLWLATRTADGWQRRTIGGQTAADLPFDGQGLAVHGDRIYVTFVRWVDEAPDALRLVEVADGAIVRKSTVVAVGENWDPRFPTVAVDAIGQPHVGFVDLCDGLAHAVRTPAGWQVENVPGRAGLDAAPSLSVTDGRHVALVTHTGSTTRCSGGNSGGVVFRTNEGGDWAGSTLEPKGVPLVGDVRIVTGGSGRSSVVWVTYGNDLMIRRER
jgi:hypothetical protein